VKYGLTFAVAKIKGSCMSNALHARNRKSCWQWKLILVWMGWFMVVRVTEGQEPGNIIPVLITNVAEIRRLTPEASAKQLPVRLTGVITYFFDERACFVQDQTAGIFVGNGSAGPHLSPGDFVTVEGTTDSGEYAPIVQPSKLEVLGHTNMPPARKVTYEDLVTGREDSQWVEIAGLVREVYAEWSEPGRGVNLEIAVGSDRFTAFVPGLTESDLADLVDSEVRVRGVCSTRFNRQRQLFNIRFLLPSVEDIVVEKPAAADVLAQPAQMIGNLMRFTVQPSVHGRRVKVVGTVIMYQPGSALFLQDKENGLYVQTRQSGQLVPGDRVESLGFPQKGEYTPILADAVWHKIGSDPEPEPNLIRPENALSGSHDSKLVAIEGRLLDHTFNNNDLVLLLESDNRVFSAHLESKDGQSPPMTLENGSLLRVTGVCRIEVGDIWRAGTAWHAKSFSILLRSPADIKVLKLPPWWNLTRLLWALGVLIVVVLTSLILVGTLRFKVIQQTEMIRQQRDVEATLKERYQDLFENANDMVYTHDLNGQLTSINMAGERLFGCKREEIHLKNLVDFISEEQRQSALQWLKQIVAGVPLSPVEWDFVPTTGGRIRLEISARLIEREGRRAEIEGVARDVTEHRRLEKEILEISTREQHRIGHDLHDGICQQLAGICFLSEILFNKLSQSKHPETEAAKKLTGLVNSVNKETRGVARGLFPVRLEENGLVSALEELANNTGAFFNTRCEFHREAPVTIRDHIVAQQLYYIAQESILNAVKHGKAGLIQIFLRDGVDRCVLTVRDNGRGLPANPGESNGMGLRIMDYRARLINATLQVSNRQEGGVEVVCELSRQSPPEGRQEMAVAI
jgi:PAS domain S-box-containing protein